MADIAMAGRTVRAGVGRVLAADLIFHVAVWSHVVMGTAVLAGGEPATWATAVATSRKAVGLFGGSNVTLGSLYLLSSALVLAEMALAHPTRPSVSWLWCYLPQQAFMVVSGYGAARAMWLGRFADAVPRPPAFIVSDQHLWLFVAVAHTLAIFRRWGPPAGGGGGH